MPKFSCKPHKNLIHIDRAYSGHSFTTTAHNFSWYIRDKTSFEHKFVENNSMLFHRQARWLATRTLAKTSASRRLDRSSIVRLLPQGNHDTTPRIDLFSKLLTTKNNWTPIRHFAAKSQDGEGLTTNSETSKSFFFDAVVLLRMQHGNSKAH